MTKILLHINGSPRQIEADPSTPLIFVLRNHLGLTAAKLGCGQEQCGCCKVLVNGEPQPTCVAPVSQFEEAEIVTAEGLTESGEPGPVQRAFVDEAAAQCGYCTAGLIIAVEALRHRNPTPDRTAIKDALTDHLCRCGTQAAVVRAAERLLRSRG
jgi:nicotinate dehydrogenase subunit A